jgi:hypothetical protein
VKVLTKLKCVTQFGKLFEKKAPQVLTSNSLWGLQRSGRFILQGQESIQDEITLNSLESPVVLSLYIFEGLITGCE